MWRKGSRSEWLRCKASWYNAAGIIQVPLEKEIQHFNSVLVAALRKFWVLVLSCLFLCVCVLFAFFIFVLLCSGTSMQMFSFPTEITQRKWIRVSSGKIHENTICAAKIMIRQKVICRCSGCGWVCFFVGVLVDLCVSLQSERLFLCMCMIMCLSVHLPVCMRLMKRNLLMCLHIDISPRFAVFLCETKTLDIL